VTWLLANAEAIRLIATIVGLAAAILGFWRYFEQRRTQISEEAHSRRMGEIEKWREAAAYEIFQRATSPAEDRPAEVGADELLSMLRNSTFDETGMDIRKEEINRQSITLLLVSMIEKGLIEHLGDNKYVLKINARDVAARGYTTSLTDPYPAILELVRANSGEFSEVELRSALGYSPFVFRQHLINLMNAGFLHFDENGMLRITHENEWAASLASAPEEAAE
jgi:uncharacterized membrane protein